MSIIAYGVYYALQQAISGKISTVIAIFLAAIVYGIFILVLKVFSKDEMEELPFLKKFARFTK